MELFGPGSGGTEPGVARRRAMYLFWVAGRNLMQGLYKDFKGIIIGIMQTDMETTT